METKDLQQKYKIIKKMLEEFGCKFDFSETDELMKVISRYKNLDEVIKSLLKVDNEKKEIVVNEEEKLNEILKGFGIEKIKIEVFNLDLLKEFESSKKITKKNLEFLAEKLGIAKMSYKTKKDVLDEIRRNLRNINEFKDIQNLIK